MKQMPKWWLPELAVVIGIPAISVLGGILTLAVASGDLSDDTGHTSASGNSQVQTADVAPDLAAARDGLSAQLQLDRARGEARVQLPHDVPAREEIVLSFVHSLRAGDDVRARLQARDGLWIAKLAPDVHSRWRVVLAGSDQQRPDRRWRLVGTLPRDGASLSLQPAVAPP